MTKVPGSERARRWHPRPHQQIVAMALIALSALATVSVVMGIRTSQVEARNRQVATRDIPVVTALTNAQLLYASNIAQATQLLAATGSDRATSITDLAEKTLLADSEWDTYRRLATGVRNETRLQRVAETSEAEQIRLITPSLSSATLTPATTERIAQLGSQQLGAVDTLRASYAVKQATELAALSADVQRTRRDLLVTTGVELAFLLLTFGAVYLSVRRRDRQVSAIESERLAAAGRNDLETRLARSLEMVHTEDATYPRVQRALTEVVEGRSSELLVAGTSGSRLRQVLASGEAAEGHGCAVSDPASCPAVTRGQAQVFARSDALDACPYLAGVDGCSAACVPVSIGGKALGVVHVRAPLDEPPDPETVTRLEIVARKAGDRLGALRALSRSEVEAHTDQLTGLLNRRSLHDAVRQMVDSDRQYTIAYGDLDHFKQINDVFGHDAGDHALRLFARVLRDSLRPDDIPSRYGGEEFVVVLPDCTVTNAGHVLERLREDLGRAETKAGTPPFTVSFGVTSSDLHPDFATALKAADQALALAKEQGRDRIVTWPGIESTEGASVRLSP